jgi:hypothetical protein
MFLFEYRAGIFKESFWARNRGGRGLSTGPPGYIGWWNSFLGIDSGAPYTFKNTGSVSGLSTEEDGCELKYITRKQKKRGKRTKEENRVRLTSTHYEEMVKSRTVKG